MASMDLDYAWEHGQRTYKGDKLYAKCRYCGQVVQGITRLKYHLAKIKGIVKVCTSVPDTISQGFRANFEEDPVLREGVMRLKLEQNRVPPVEDGHGDDANSSEPRRSEPLRMVIQKMEARLQKAESKIAELEQELSKKRKRDAGETE